MEANVIIRKPHVLIVLVHAENLPDGSERRESGDGEKDGFGFSISDVIRMCEPAAIDLSNLRILILVIAE